MRNFGVILTIVVCAFVLCASTASAATTRTGVIKPGPMSKAPAAHQGGAKSFFPKAKPGEKVAGYCSIDCGGGDTTITWAENVGDCACQCSDYCGTSCDAWEVNGPGRATCSVY